MATHLSTRLVWHDRAWDGHIPTRCAQPSSASAAKSNPRSTGSTRPVATAAVARPRPATRSTPTWVALTRSFPEGFDVNDPRQKYQLRSLPERLSGLHIVCLMYAAFKIINPGAVTGFDLADEYAVAQQMMRDQRHP